VSTIPKAESQPAPFEGRLQTLADLLVSYSLDVRSGEVVLVSGSVTSEPLLLAALHRIMQSGGLPLLRLIPDVCFDLSVCTAGALHDRFINPLKIGEGCPIDCSIGIWSTEDSTPAGALPSEASQKLADPERERRTAFLDQVARGRLRWVGTEYPTAASARRAGMTAAAYADHVFAAAWLDSPNPPAAWREVHDRQHRLCDYMESAREIRFTTALGTSLTVGIGGRRWVNGDGHMNLPDGEVFTAPIEDAVNGIVCCSYPVLYEDVAIHGARLEFRDGCVVNASAASGESTLLGVLDRDEGARLLGEVALGTNYRLSRFCASELLDEKMGGTFHVALGMSYPQTLGRNRSAVHCDLICDLRAGGRVEVDGRVVSVNGLFADPAWPRP
jgi:aminopeptidase